MTLCLSFEFQFFHGCQTKIEALVKEIHEFQDKKGVEKIISMITTGGKFSYPEFKEAVGDAKQTRQVCAECMSSFIFAQILFLFLNLY